jgi:hypothetical protein
MQYALCCAPVRSAQAYPCKNDPTGTKADSRTLMKLNHVFHRSEFYVFSISPFISATHESLLINFFIITSTGNAGNLVEKITKIFVVKMIYFYNESRLMYFL